MNEYHEYKKSRSEYKMNPPGQESFSADVIVVKAAIEFCLSIQSSDFLFDEIYQLFSDNNMQLKFI